MLILFQDPSWYLALSMALLGNCMGAKVLQDRPVSLLQTSLQAALPILLPSQSWLAEKLFYILVVAPEHSG